MTVVPYRVPDEEPRSWVALMSPAIELAKAIANTDFVPNDYRGNPAAISAAILYGDEIGLGPMQSLSMIAVIQGRPTLRAQAQVGLILSHGHEFWVEEATTTRVTVAGRRKDSDKTNTVTWTLDDAKRAGIGGKDNWRRYPRQMLLARATAELARAVFADAIGGLAAIEELEDMGDVDLPGSDVQTSAAPATTKRRRRTISPAPPTPTPPAPAPTPAPKPPLPGEPEPQDFARPQTHPDFDKPAAAAPVRPQEPPQTPPDNKQKIDDRPITEPMTKALNALVGKFRDQGTIETRYVYGIVGALRGSEPDPLALEVGGVDTEGVLHWSPLRDTLNRTEGIALREHLARVSAKADEAQARAAFEASNDPGGQLPA